MGWKSYCEHGRLESPQLVDNQVQALTLDVEKDYWGRENCTDVLVLSRPDMVRDIHRGYFEAGADMVETNPFGASPVTLAEFDLADSRCPSPSLRWSIVRAERSRTARRSGCPARGSGRSV